ncbi:MAG: DegT/DnrJ/EryC1/StrS family aminotransferase [Calditrichia bacterium]
MIEKREKFLPFALPAIGEEEIQEVVDSLRSGWVTTGPKVNTFEKNFAAYIGCKHAVAVNSCTAGLHTALRVLGIGPGDEVIVPTLTFCATANVVEHLGARPVLVDVAEDFNITPSAIEAALSPRTRAIMPVHHSGQSCNLDEIYALAAEKNLAVVEDAAHAVGSIYHDRKIGSDAIVQNGKYPDLKRVAAFSFYATKNMTTGEGGMVVTADDELADKIRLMILHGMSRDAWKRYSSAGTWYYEVLEAGYKYNMTDIQAAMGIHQLEKLDRFIRIRQKLAKLYDEGFRNIPEIKTPIVHPDRNHIYHLYVIRLELEQLKIDRAQFIEKLKEFNIGASVHFIPVHLHPYYARKYGYKRGDLPVSENLYGRIISLPLYPGMTEEDARYVIGVIRYLTDVYRR